MRPFYMTYNHLSTLFLIFFHIFLFFLSFHLILNHFFYIINL
nr:MAG TPA: hypothetical protein [Caudoviricetes sp.]